jgi:hypothetical protein
MVSYRRFPADLEGVSRVLNLVPKITIPNRSAAKKGGANAAPGGVCFGIFQFPMSIQCV